MQRKNMTMFYISAGLVIIGAVSYRYLTKRIPVSLNPIVSMIGVYTAVLALGAFLLLLFPSESSISQHFRQLSWIQLGLAISTVMVALGFLLMYRYGWNLSTGNIVTGVFINIIHVTLGVTLLGEKINLLNVIGIALCILGVALISLRS